jgi:hypothetical protein
MNPKTGQRLKGDLDTPGEGNFPAYSTQLATSC